jgi:hypothetical protein
MRKFLMIALAAVGLALASPVTASAAPVISGAAINQAVDTMSPVVDAAWHCRRWSGWCRGGPHYRHYWHPRRHHWRHHHWRRHHWHHRRYR